MVENNAFQAPENEVTKKVWWVLVKKYPGLADFNDIKTLLMDIYHVQLDDHELSRVLRELRRLRLADFYENRGKAGARIDEEALNNAVEKELASEDQKGDLETKRENLHGDAEYLTAVMGLYQGKASSFASLFIAVLFGVYALVATIPGLHSYKSTGGLLLGLPWSIPALVLGCAVTSLGILALLVAWQYYKYASLTDETNRALYRDAASREEFVRNTADWQGTCVRPVTYGCAAAVVALTVLIAILFLLPLGL